MYALSYGSALVRTGAVQNAVVIGSDTLSAFMDWEDRRPSVVFGDGAGAVVMQATDQPVGIMAEVLGCYYSSRDVLRIKGIGTAYANAGVTLGTTAWDFDGAEVFRQAVLAMTSAANDVLAKGGLTDHDIDLIIPHQANLRILEAVARRLGVSMTKVFTHIRERGNLSSASIPVALVDALEQGRLMPNSRVLVPAFGGGMTWSAHVVQWGDRSTPLGASAVTLPPTQMTGLELVHELRKRKGGKPGRDLPEISYPQRAVHLSMPATALAQQGRQPAAHNPQPSIDVGAGQRFSPVTAVEVGAKEH
jgi:3-oxoacyl-[acyl-carrier-protein] synthase-3